MFSGGLDSLAGAVETARTGGRLALVSHRSVSTLDRRQRRIFSELQNEFPGRLIHIPVWVNKSVGLGREPTQRTRSFLFAALGTVVAELIEAGGVRFFENGVVSLNFPVADEVVRARASRTTHPVSLHLLQCLRSKIAGHDFAVDNPYLFKTKTEVTESLAQNQAGHLIPYTCSCAHPMFQPKTQWHCGKCSQCIDRRFAVIGAGLSAYDLETDYVTDVFVGPGKEGPEKSKRAPFTSFDPIRSACSLPSLVKLPSNGPQARDIVKRSPYDCSESKKLQVTTTVYTKIECKSLHPSFAKIIQ